MGILVLYVWPIDSNICTASYVREPRSPYYSVYCCSNVWIYPLLPGLNASSTASTPRAVAVSANKGAARLSQVVTEQLLAL